VAARHGHAVVAAPQRPGSAGTLTRNGSLAGSRAVPASTPSAPTSRVMPQRWLARRHASAATAYQGPDPVRRWVDYRPLIKIRRHRGRARWQSTSPRPCP
jgi:hypothetical protein